MRHPFLGDKSAICLTVCADRERRNEEYFGSVQTAICGVEGEATLLVDSSMRTTGGLGVQCQAPWLPAASHVATSLGFHFWGTGITLPSALEMK